MKKKVETLAPIEEEKKPVKKAVKLSKGNRTNRSSSRCSSARSVSLRSGSVSSRGSVASETGNVEEDSTSINILDTQETEKNVDDIQMVDVGIRHIATKLLTTKAPKPKKRDTVVLADELVE